MFSLSIHKKIHPPAEFLADSLGAFIAPMGIVKQEHIFLSFLHERQQAVFAQHDLWNISEDITYILIDPLGRVRIIRYIVLIEVVFIHSHHQHQLDASLMSLTRQHLKHVLHLRNDSLINRQSIFNISIIEILFIGLTTAEEIPVQVNHIHRTAACKPIEDEITAKRAILAKWADELDPGSLRAISKFEDEVSKLMVQLDEYKALAARLRMNGENLKDIIDSVHF